MNNNYNNGFNYGVKLACLYNGIGEGDFIRTTAKHRVLSESPDMQATICKIASSIFHAAGDPDTAAVYDSMVEGTSCIKSAHAKSILLDSVLEAIAEQSAMEKQAAWVTGLLGRGIGLMPDFLRGGAALSLLVGGGLGAGWWALNRDSVASSAKTAIKEEQAKYYRELAKKIRTKAGKNRAKKLDKETIKAIIAETAPGMDEQEQAEKNKNVADTLINAASDLYV